MERKVIRGTGPARFIVFQPGNSTRYELVLAKVPDSQSVVLCWLNPPTAQGRVGLFAKYMTPIHYSYVMEKMDCCAADAAPLLVLLHEETDYGVSLPPGYDEQGKYNGSGVEVQLGTEYR